jgi:lipopolysaccharide biosynthesis regulator YciM
MSRGRHVSRLVVAVALAAALAVAAVTPAQAARRPRDQLPTVRVQDLYYGDVLFYFYQGNELEALTRLEAYTHWQRMPHNSGDAQLLAGGLYLSLGMHNEAGRRFEALLTDRIPPLLRNRAWYYLARIWYDRGYYDRAELALGRIQGTLPTEQEAERMHLLINVLMHQQRYDEVIAHSQNWKGAPDWMAYTRFNFGVALVRAGRLAEADPMLTAVGTLNTQSDELLNLRDKANLALGFAYLQAGQNAQALGPLERVRLDGPYSSRALLGDGWARAQLGDFRAALRPWLALHDRNLLDAAVQESFLAVPFAYSKLNANGEAADFYESALKSFASESDALDTAIDHIHGGHILDELLGEDKNGRHGWFWQLQAPPDVPESRYLYAILADNDFQEGLKNYRDLAFMRTSLESWDDSMEAFAAMIDTRERAYAERLPRTDALLATEAPAHMRAARAQIESRLNAIETDDDVAALGSPTEREQWARVTRLGEQLEALPPGLEREAAADKLRLIKGALYWRLDSQFKTRSYEQRHALHEIDVALNELQNRWARVQRARATVPSNNGEFAARIAALSARIQALHDRLAQGSQQQGEFLEGLAVSELQAQKDRLAAYAVQARFQLADIYDRAADQGPAGGATATGPAMPVAAPDAPAAVPAPSTAPTPPDTP